MHPKDKRDTPSTTGCIHEVLCVNCNESYVGETGRRLERLNEHKKEAEKDEKSKRILLVKLKNNLKVSSLNLLSQTTRSSITTSLIGNMQKSLHRSVSRMCTILRNHLDQKTCTQHDEQKQGANSLSNAYDPLLTTPTSGDRRNRRGDQVPSF